MAKIEAVESKRVVWSGNFVLTLSPEEALAVRDVLHHVGGSVNGSRRGLTAGVKGKLDAKLLETGVMSRDYRVRDIDPQNDSIYFMSKGGLTHLT